MQSTFISYGSPDEPFARKLYEALKQNNVTTFFFAEHAVPGEKLHRLMRNGVNEYDRVILVCSKNSLDRTGVLNEIEELLAREARNGGTSYLIPVRLDNYVFHGWNPPHPDTAQAIRDRVVADFEGAESNQGKFDVAFSRLLLALSQPTRAQGAPYARDGLSTGVHLRSENVRSSRHQNPRPGDATPDTWAGYPVSRLGKPQRVAETYTVAGLQRIQDALITGTEAQIHKEIKSAHTLVRLTQGGSPKTAEAFSVGEQVIVLFNTLDSDTRNAAEQCRRQSIDLFGDAAASADLREQMHYILKRAIEQSRPKKGPFAPDDAVSKRLPPVTQSTLSALLSRMLATDSDFTAFCIDCFPILYRSFDVNLDRQARTDQLLAQAGPELVMTRLKDWEPATFHRYHHLLFAGDCTPD